MAKSTKKPNSFSKGMMSDLDANVLPPDTYKEAVGVRLLTRDDNSFVLKNAQGNTVFTTLTDTVSTITFSDALALASTNIVNLANPQLLGWKITITGDDGFTPVIVEAHTGILYANQTWGVGTGFDQNVSSNGMMTIGLLVALQNSTVANKVNISATINNNAEYIISYSNRLTENMTIAIQPYVYHGPGGEVVYFQYIDYPGSLNSSNIDYEALGVAEFSNYIAIIAKTSTENALDAIFKITPSDDFSSSTTDIILRTDLGLTSKELLRVELSEENEHFHRIYWTDGVNPLRTINLKEDANYYLDKTAEDLNVFKESKLLAPVVQDIIGGGNVSCGAHSYCYRLVTTDGKTSRVSNITNPINIVKTVPSTSYHETLGGSLSTNSSNAVSLRVDNIDNSYGTIQIIDITYTSAEGAITANIISESQITSNTFNYTHNGNETKVSVSIGELLRSHISWNICADIAIKDNRLFAANLTNNADSIDVDFRVKSYKYASDGTGTATTYAGTENNDIHEDTLYVDGRFGFLEKTHTAKIPGAETPNYDNITDGVRVTFATKKFDLSQVKYFDNSNVIDTSSAHDKAKTTIGQVPHYGYIDKNIDGGFNNYKNPLFTEKFTGYQRGEIYRFGILFYDLNGNPTFVSPIGDIRMPDGTMEYITNDTANGRVVGNTADGQLTFKHAGNITKKIDSVVKSSNTTLTLNGIGAQLSIGDIVSGVGIRPGTYVASIAGDNNSVTISMTATDSATSTLYFDTPTDDVHGFVMYPKFQVKLSADTRSKISGYSIVRVDRTEQDKSILSSGVLNQTIIHANVDGNDSMKHKNGTMFSNIYSPAQAHQSVSCSTFTYDTPESTLGSLNYSKRSGDKIKIVARLDAGFEDFNADTVPDFATIGTQNAIKHLRQYETSYNNFLLSGRYDPKSTSNDLSYQYSQKVIYTQYYTGVNDVINATTGSAQNINRGIREIDYGQNIGPAESVSSNKQGYDNHGTGRTTRPFINKARVQSIENVFVHVPDEFATKKLENHVSGDAVTLHGVESIYISLGGRTETYSSANIEAYEIQPEHFQIGKEVNSTNKNPFILNFNDDAEVDKQYCFAQKLYGQIRRDVRESQYGGSSPSNYESNQYISTGHVNFNPQTLNNDEVFGGDTYINMYSLQKFAREDGVSLGSKMYPSPAIIFPVESSVNIDLRDGTFFGSTNNLSYLAHDAFLLNETYRARNTSKTFLQKPANFKDVNNYGNLIASSNLKLAGDLFDAFTTWDANEIHELDSSKGAIYNLFNLRNELFALQSKGVSKLSINPRVVVDNADASAVTIVTGTGQVIQRSDYVDTMYGSQHYNNLLVTNTSAYWYDSHMSAFCKLVFGKGLAVQDLGITTQNSNIFNALKNSPIGDKPLDYIVGGIALYYNKIFDEVGICITTANNNSITHMVYSELQDVMVSKRKDVVALAFNLPGELLTVGRNSGVTSIDASEIYLENSNSTYNQYYAALNNYTLDVTFVCNENVYTTKKFDKLVLYLSGNENDQKFTTFTFTDSVSNTSFTQSVGDNLIRMSHGKHVIPITNADGTAKATGQHLIINIQSSSGSSIELFGALVHNRITT